MLPSIPGFSIEEAMIARAYSGCRYIWSIFMPFDSSLVTGLSVRP